MISNPRHDIIQKLLADLASIFAELAGFNTSDALEEIQSYYQEWLGLNGPSWKSPPPDELLNFLLSEKKFTLDRLELLAQLLSKEGEILADNQQFDIAKDHLRKALFIFDYVENQSTVFSLHRRQIIQNTKSLFTDIS